MMSSVVQVQWCDTKLRISPPIMNAVETWQGCCTLWNIPGGTHFDVAMATCLVPVSCLFKMKYYHLQLNKAKFLVPPSLGLLFNIFNSIFCPVQLQMVIFDFKEEGTGTEHVAIATSKCVLPGIFLRVQHPCQVSIALLHYWQRHS